MITTNKQAANFTEIAYNYEKLSSAVQHSIKDHLAKMPQGWEVLSYSGEKSNTAAYNYRAVAFVNHQSKEVVIANAGTDPKSIADLNDDARLMKHDLPLKAMSSQAFIESITSKINGVKGYSFATTGHSLGGVMSDIVACQLTEKGFKVSESITFDNPGARPLIEKAIKNGTFKALTMRDLDRNIDFVSMQARPNIINTTNEQMGATKIVIAPKTLPSQDSQIHSKVAIENPGVTGYISHLFSKVGSAASSLYNNFDITKYSIGDVCSGVKYVHDFFSNMHDTKYLISELAKLAGAEDIKDLAMEALEVGKKLYEKGETIYEKAKKVVNTCYKLKEPVSKTIKIATNIVTLLSSQSKSSDLKLAYETCSEIYNLIKDCAEITQEVIEGVRAAAEVATLVSRVDEHGMKNFDKALQLADANNIFDARIDQQTGHVTLKGSISLTNAADVTTTLKQEEPGFLKKAWNWLTGDQKTVTVDHQTDEQKATVKGPVKMDWAELTDLIYQADPEVTLPITVADDHQLTGQDDASEAA